MHLISNDNISNTGPESGEKENSSLFHPVIAPQQGGAVRSEPFWTDFTMRND